LLKENWLRNQKEGEKMMEEHNSLKKRAKIKLAGQQK